MTIYKAINWRIVTWGSWQQQKSLFPPKYVETTVPELASIVHMHWFQPIGTCDLAKKVFFWRTGIVLLLILAWKCLLTRPGHDLIRLKFLKWSWNDLWQAAAPEEIFHAYIVGGWHEEQTRQDKMRSQLAACLSHLFLFQHFATTSTVF